MSFFGANRARIDRVTGVISGIGKGVIGTCALTPCNERKLRYLEKED